jgi:translation initiation factor IF-3
LKENKENLPLMNEQIRFPRLQVISSEGENLGVISRADALLLAERSELDMVLIAEMGKEGAPVVKIMDFGKELYEKKKKQVEAKKKQKVVQVKEIKLRPKIGCHDYQTKMKQALDFLQTGKHVKISVFFRGRENVTRNERGTEMFDRISKTFEDFGILKDLVQERDSQIGQVWSRIYYLKNVK